jgi:hypothetical protein
MSQEYIEGEALPWVINVLLPNGSHQLVKVWSTNHIDAIRKAVSHANGISGEVN